MTFLEQIFIQYTSLAEVKKKSVPGWKSSDGYLFVKYNFAFPHDAHQTGRTKVIASTNSPGILQLFFFIYKSIQ